MSMPRTLGYAHLVDCPVTGAEFVGGPYDGDATRHWRVGAVTRVWMDETLRYAPDGSMSTDGRRVRLIYSPAVPA